MSLLDDVPVALPALSRAAKLQKRAAQVGFDWPEALPVVDKVREELDEVLEAMAEGDEGAVGEEVGDLLFVVVNLARHLKVDPEAALPPGQRQVRSGDSGSSSGTCAKPAGKPKSVRWRNWTASGARLRKRRGRARLLMGKLPWQPGCLRHLNQPKIQR